MTGDLADWDRAADAYAQIAAGATDDAWNSLAPVVAEAVGDPAGKRLLDLGCGPAWLAHRWCRAGATVTGIDASAAMLAHAQPHERLTLRQADLTAPVTGLGVFDVAIANMVVHDLSDIGPLLATAAGAVAEGGALIITLPHPCFYNYPIHVDFHSGRWWRQVAGYLRHERWRIARFGGHHHYHRPLGYYIGHIVQAGFAVTGLAEPVHHSRRLEHHNDMPLFAAITAVRLPGGADGPATRSQR